LASAGYGQERAPTAPVVLPLTNRGLVLTDGVCRVILGVAMVASAALILYLNRGTTLFVDQLSWFVGFGTGPDIDQITRPSNGHLLAIPLSVSLALFEAFDASNLPFRLLGALSVLLTAGLFFELVRRKVGSVVALAPTLLLLFLGSDWQHVLAPQGYSVLISVAGGLAALLALERDDRRGDVLACASLCLAVLSFSVGVAFLAGVAVSVLARRDRRRRAWIFLVPFALYAAWWLWSLQFIGTGDARLANLLLIPAWSAESLGLVLAALVGLDYEFSAPPGTEVFNLLETGYGPILVAICIGALAWRIRRGSVPVALWASLTILLVYWSLIALTSGSGGRVPVDVRYVYPAAVGVLLVAADATTGVRFSKWGLLVLYAVAAIGISTNIAILRDAGAWFRGEYSRHARAQLAMLELGRDHLPPGFRIGAKAPEVAALHLDFRARSYLAAADRFGSLAFSLAELQRQDEVVRQGADLVLIRALELEPVPAPPPGEACVRQRPQQGGVSFAVPDGGAIVRLGGSAPAELGLRRFATATVQSVGSLAPGRLAALRVPPDASSMPWIASIPASDPVTVCSLAPRGRGDRA
jgi:hypothetical protein